MSDDATMRALAKHFFDCVEKGDVDGLVACYTPDAKIWHNTDGIEKSPEDNRKALKGMTQRLVDRVYDERRVYVYAEGFTHQHVLRGTRVHDGARLALPACIICTVKDGKITRLDEYFDSTAVAEFRKFA